MTDIEKPKDKYWKVHKNDVGRELANPDYVEWADNKIVALTTEVERLRDLVGVQRELIELLEREVCCLVWGGKGAGPVIWAEKEAKLRTKIAEIEKEMG